MIVRQILDEIIFHVLTFCSNSISFSHFHSDNTLRLPMDSR